MIRYEFDAIGTKWQIEIPLSEGDTREVGLLSEIKDRIEAFDRAYSRFRQDSLVTRMSEQAGTFTLPPDAAHMLALYRDLYDRTGGLFTPLVGDLLADAGYDATYTLRQKKNLEVAPSWDDTFEYRAQENELLMRVPAMLDFGAGGKGYLVDRIAQVLEDAGIAEYVIDASGDIVHKGYTPVRIGLEDPEDSTKAIGFCDVQNGSICGSAHNRRAWGDFTHIIDPKKLSSPRDILAVWVTAKSALLADALATCLFFVSPDTLRGAYDFEYVIMREDRSAEKSSGFTGELFVSS